MPAISSTPTNTANNSGRHSTRSASLALLLICVSALFITCSPSYIARDNPLLNTCAPRDASSARADAWFTELTRRRLFSGTVLLARRGKVLLHRAYGYQDWDSGRKNSVRTVFRIASLSKLLTASLVLRCLDEKQASVHLPLRYLLPGWTNNITIHQLLSHRSGLPRDLPKSTGKTFPQKLSGIAREALSITNLKTSGEGVKNFHYSNLGYQLLAAAFENFCRTEFYSLLQKVILRPAGMASTDWSGNSVAGREQARGHRLGKAGPYPITSNRLHSHGSGSLSSTSGDLFLFMQAWRQGLLLQESSRQRMFRQYSKESGYGYGLRYFPHKDRDCWWHSGAVFGFRSYLAWYPEEEVLFIVLANLADTPMVKTASMLAEFFFG